MITPYLPYPPSSGGQVRSYNLIKQLGGKHEITLFSLIKDSGERKYIKELEKYCQKVVAFGRPLRPWTLRNILKTAFGLYPFLVVRNLSRGTKNALVKELKERKYDLIHAETFYVMPHLPFTRVPILLVEQTIEYQVYAHFINSLPPFLFFLKPFLRFDVLKLKWWEKKYWQKADRVVAVSEDDKKKMKAQVDSLEVDVVPNGAGEDLINVWRQRKPAKSPIIFFQANFSWLQNVEAAHNLAKKVFPLICKEIPEAECWIVGQGAQEKIGVLAAPKIKIVDLKTADIDGVINAYRQATIFVAPLQGPGGTRLKILAAMAAGVPVVTTKVGIEGIAATDGREAYVHDSWKKMAQATVALIKKKRLYQKTVRLARQLVEDHYSYPQIAKRLERIYKEVAYG